jgi:UDP-glucose 4-epimerase
VSETILVTGGAGYIGSHTVQQLLARGESVVVLDNLSTGFRQSVPGVKLVTGDVGDSQLLAALLREHGIRTVIHFAAHTIVPESVADPLKYYGNNTCQTRSLLATCAAGGVKHFVFSSTAAVYGIPESGLAAEDARLAPINPYGTSKLMSEWMLRDLGAATDLRYVVLRYFNVAGSDPQGRIGQSTRKATLRVKVACEASVGRREAVSIFLHPCRGPRRCAPAGGGLPAGRWRIPDPQLRLRTWLQRARGARQRAARERRAVEDHRDAAAGRRSAQPGGEVRPHPPGAGVAAAPR